MIRVLEGIKPQSRVARHTVQQEGQLAPKADTHPYLPELTRTHNDDDGGADGNAKEVGCSKSVCLLNVAHAIFSGDP
eukprot:scaffold232080_cov18-Tisochrysis_lutea.AAC.1